MDLTTRCPQCGTTFQASLEQLQLRKGYVRCVQCAHIFDGYEAVVAADSTDDDRTEPTLISRQVSPHKTTVVSPTPEQPALPADDVARVPSSEPVALPSVVRARREFTISEHHSPVISDVEPSLGLSRLMADRSTEAGDGTDHIIAGLDADHVQIDPDEHFKPVHRTAAQRDMDDTHPGRWAYIVPTIWRVLIVAGIIVFAAQLVYVFRVQLAENIPALRPGLERMCDALNCTVAYSRQPDMIVITQSSLQKDAGADADADDNNDDNVLVLQLTLRNAYDKPQEWPTLVVDLKDFSGASIARKNLPKEAYLPEDLVNTPFPASSERLIVLPLALQGLQVNGYQLTAFFP